MKLTILGEYGPFPAADGACSGYLLESEGARVLLDCGPGVLARLARHCPVEALSAVVLSHLHYDHMSDLLPMLYALDFSSRREKLPLYLPDAPQKVRELLAGGKFDARAMEPFRLGGLDFSFLDALHPVKGYCVKVREGERTFVYTGDTNWQDTLVPFAQGADLLLADAGLPDGMWGAHAPHMSARHCGRLAKACGAGMLLLTHLRPDVSAEALLRQAREEFPEARLAKSGMTVSL